MKTVLLVPAALALIFNVESCPVTRPTESASANESREMANRGRGGSAMEDSGSSHSAEPQASLAIEDLRKNVREIINPRCGSCHTSTLATAKPKAIKIFDLAREDWSGMITKDHFKGLERRLQDLNESDKKMVSEFIRAEPASRQ